MMLMRFYGGFFVFFYLFVVSHYEYLTLWILFYCLLLQFFTLFSFRSILDGIQYLEKWRFFQVSEFSASYFSVNKLLF